LEGTLAIARGAVVTVGGRTRHHRRGLADRRCCCLRGGCFREGGGGLCGRRFLTLGFNCSRERTRTDAYAYADARVAMRKRATGVGGVSTRLAEGPTCRMQVQWIWGMVSRKQQGTHVWWYWWCWWCWWCYWSGTHLRQADNRLDHHTPSLLSPGVRPPHSFDRCQVDRPWCTRLVAHCSQHSLCQIW
jgi:hypothetical protein